jgi:hypothetical protein
MYTYDFELVLALQDLSPKFSVVLSFKIKNEVSNWFTICILLLLCKVLLPGKLCFSRLYGFRTA